MSVLNWRRLVAPVVVGAAYAVAAVFGRYFVDPGLGVAIIWPAAGVAVGGVACVRRSQRSATLYVVVLANVVVNLATGAPVGAALGFAAAAGVGAAVGTAILRPDHGQETPLEALRNLWRVVVAAVGGGSSAALLGVLLVAAPGGMAPLATGLAWIQADAIGILIFAPAVIAVAHRQTSRLTPEVVRSVVVGVGAGSLMITLFLAAGSVDQPLMYMALAIMMIAATVIGGRNLMVVVAAVTVIMANLTIAGYGPFTTGAGATDVASMQLFAAVVMLSSGAVARIHRRSKTLADQLGKVFDAARSPVLVVSKSGQIELENRAAIEVFGGHVAGSSLAAVFGADTVSELLEAEEPIEVKAAIGGVDHTFDVRSGRFDSEDGPAYVLIARDISESIEASRRIRQLSAIVEASPNFIGFATAEGLISYLSPGARAMTGFGDGPASDVEVGGLSPEWAAEQLRTVAIPAAREHGVWQGDSAYLGPEGEEIPVAQTVIAHRSESGEIEMYSTIAMDLSDRVRAERARSELVANIVHDLKNPLVAISGAGEMLDDDVEAGLGIDAQLVQIVRAGALQLRELVEDLIETERVRRLRSTPVEVVDIAGLARQVASLHLIRAGQQGVDLLIRGVPSPVLGHRSELHRLVENLVTNAIKYSPEGGAVIVEVGLADDRVVLSVTDNGIGIAPADLDFMFTRYHRAQTARTAGIGGTGLGLAICKEIAAHHGGSIEVDSRVGVGSTFTVALPLAEDLTLAGDRASAGA